MDMNDHAQYNHTRMGEQELQPAIPMTPIHELPSQQPQLESPLYGQNTDLPHYELMIVYALQAINDPNGSPPKQIWDWMNRYLCAQSLKLTPVITHATQSSGHQLLKLCKKLSRKDVY
jgi:hypothetical protein